MKLETVDHKRSGETRLAWLDALKGVGILAVVAGHVWTRGAFRDAVYAFHMPLFFLASGYTLRAVGMGQLLPRLFTGLLVPFLAFSTILLAADFLIEGWRGVRPIFSSFAEGYATILLKTEATRGPFTILWFVPCLIVARFIWNGLALLWPDPRDWRWPLVIIALLISAGLLGPARSPFGIVAVPGALALIWLGALWRQVQSAMDEARRWQMPAFAFMAIVTLAFARPMNMKLGDLGVPALSLLGAGAVTIMLAALLRYAPERMVRLLAGFGQASLVIMYLHVAVVHYLMPYFSRPVLFILALVLSLLIDRAARLHPLSRRVLLGAKA